MGGDKHVGDGAGLPSGGTHGTQAVLVVFVKALLEELEGDSSVELLLLGLRLKLILKAQKEAVGVSVKS